MVRAILDGRKTQTRRLIKPEVVNVVPFIGRDDKPTGEFGLCLTHDRVINKHARCPYGVPGDMLWVREAWSAEWSWRDEKPRDMIPCAPIWYWADGNPTDRDWTRPKPSIHMPRWASRITLRVTDVRVERLNEISEADAKAEGAPCGGWDEDGESFYETGAGTYTAGYIGVWEHINGPGSWDANPWVWAVSFERAPS